MKTLIAVGTLAVLGLLLPGAAFAHIGAATVSCTGAELTYTDFPAGSNTVNYKLTVDSNTVAEGTFVLDSAGGSEGHLVVPLTLYDTHQVVAYSWWGPAGVEKGETREADSPPLADQTVHCPAAPPAPVVAPSPPAAVTVLPAVATPTPPAIAVLGESVRSPTVRVTVQSACAARHARVTVAGRLMRQVRFSVTGHRARVVNVRPGARSVTALVALRRKGPAVQAVRARITFRNGAPVRTLTAAAHRCGQAAVLPQFTG
jgi:hypothetical protein